MTDCPKNEFDDVWLVALETSGKSGSATIGRGGKILATRSPSNDSRSACSLAPSIQSLLAEVDVKPSQLSCVAVTAGPGSFTGLRVGVATAKTMAFALEIPAVQIDTLNAIAWQVQQWSNNNPSSLVDVPLTRFWTIMDAFRGELFVAEWEIDQQGKASCLIDSQLMTISNWVAKMNEPETNTETGIQSFPLVAGPGLSRCDSLLRPETGRVPSNVGDPNSESVFALGWRKFVEGQTTSADRLLPIYLRQSAAEEKKQSLT
jgi:tRNA threonylcarbamoyladenosine biosynthesis protein TsaB